MTLALIRTVPWDEERRRWASELGHSLLRQGVAFQVVLDRERSGYSTFLDALDRQTELGQGCWHLEDDVIASSQFSKLARAAEFAHGRGIIQGFSRMRQDAEKGSRYVSGRFYYNTCFYVPEGLSAPLRAYCAQWREDHRESEHNVEGAYDCCIRDFLKERGEKYWLVVPSLVQHRPAKSLIGGAGRTVGRQSPTFVP